MEKFKIGDRVKVINEGPSHNAKIGMVGTIIINKTPGPAYYGVVFDKPFKLGHDLCGKCKDGCGQWMDDEDIAKVDSNNLKIVVTVEGNTTLARLYKDNKVVKSAEAKCSPEDTFDFNIGAKLAVERLVGEETPKYYNGKIICIKSHPFACYKVGHIYEVKDGRFKNENGYMIPLKPAKALDEINKCFSGLFENMIEFAEVEM